MLTTPGQIVGWHHSQRYPPVFIVSSCVRVIPVDVVLTLDHSNLTSMLECRRLLLVFGSSILHNKMSLTSADLNALNDDLHIIVGGTGQPPDYTRDRVALTPILDRLNTDGWIVESWQTQASIQQKDAPNTLTWQTTPLGGVLQLRRSYRISITREPDHQALVEARGEVRTGENTYLRVVSEVRQVEVGAEVTRFDRRTTDDAVTAIALQCRPSFARGARPIGREEDLT